MNADSSNQLFVYFDHSGLKIADGGKPEELIQAEWDRIRAKDSRVYDRMLERLGYDAQMDHKWIRVLPHALSKVTPNSKPAVGLAAGISETGSLR